MEIVQVDGGDDLISAISGWAETMGVRTAQLSVIGAADEFTLSTMPGHDATRDALTTYSQPAEMVGCSGEIHDGQVHLHAGMAIEGDRVVGGHLHAAKIGTHFARVYVTR